MQPKANILAYTPPQCSKSCFPTAASSTVYDRLGGSNHIVWKSPEYGGVAHQASKIPQETEDTPVPVVEDESLHKIMSVPKNM